MADTKISALTAATTPLAGTEVLPIVQSGATKKVAVSDLTAGRAVAMASAAITGGLVVDTTTLVADATNNAVGFGTATPQEAVDIYGASAGVLRLSTPNRSYNIFANNSNGYLYIRDVTGSSNRVYIDTSGNATVSTGNLVIGTSGKGIDFSAASHAAGMTSELLNDYEEGTWTPTLTPSTSGSITVNASFVTAAYTKTGRVVSVQGLLRVGSVSSPVGTTVQMSLPFTVADLPNFAGRFGGAFNLNGVVYPMQGEESTTYVILVANATTFVVGADVYFSFSYIAA